MDRVLYVLLMCENKRFRQRFVFQEANVRIALYYYIILCFTARAMEHTREKQYSLHTGVPYNIPTYIKLL